MPTCQDHRKIQLQSLDVSAFLDMFCRVVKACHCGKLLHALSSQAFAVASDEGDRQGKRAAKLFNTQKTSNISGATCRSLDNIAQNQSDATHNEK